MRTILFFDLPTLTNQNQKSYRHFVKNIKKIGFYMIQESVYVKLSLDFQSCNSTINKINDFLPREGNIIVLNVTEKQFSRMQVLLGEAKTDIITNDSRTIYL